jgi:hypothetical protein
MMSCHFAAYWHCRIQWALVMMLVMTSRLCRTCHTGERERPYLRRWMCSQAAQVLPLLMEVPSVQLQHLLEQGRRVVRTTSR